MSRTLRVTQNLRYEDSSGPDLFYVKNGSGGALGPGDVVIWKTGTSTGDEVNTTTSADSLLVAGVILDNIANGAWGYMYGLREHRGAITTVKVDGTTDIAVGDEISTFTTAKIAAKAGAGKGGNFGIALEAYSTNDSSGVINVLLHSPSRVNSLASSATLDDAYNNGKTITIDDTAVVMAGSHATNDVLQITNASGTGALIDLAQSGTGNDIEGTSDTWVVTKAGVATFVGLVVGATNLDMNGNDIILDAGGLSKFELGTDNQVSLLLNSVEEYTWSATSLDLQGNNLVLTADAATYFANGTNDQIGVFVTSTERFRVRATALQFIGGNYTINDSNNNEVIGIEAVTSATSYLNVKNSNGSYVDLECLGGVDQGFRFANDQDEFMLRITPVATATVYLEISNAATGNPVIFKTIGENDRGFTWHNAEGEELLEIRNEASATNTFRVNAQVTGSNVELGANCTGATADRGITLIDSNGNELWKMNAVASAINEITYINAATGVNPSFTISSSGAENQGLTIDAIGTGTHTMRSGVSGTNSILAILSLHQDSTGNGAAGFGTRLDYYLENGASQNERHCSVDAVVVTATDAAEDSDLRFMVMDGGTIGEGLRIAGASKTLLTQDGIVGAPGYAFLSDVDTGIRLRGTALLSMVVAGADQVTFDAVNTIKGLRFEVEANANITDENANRLLKFTRVGSATTAVEILNAATGTTGPLIRSIGETNVNLRIGGIGTGQLDIVNATAGGAAAPDIVIAGDVDTGIFGGTNIWAVATAGAEALRISALQNVHIGNSTGAATNAGQDSLYFTNAAVNPSGTIASGAALYCSAGEIYTLDSGGVATLQS